VAVVAIKVFNKKYVNVNGGQLNVYITVKSIKFLKYGDTAWVVIGGAGGAWVVVEFLLVRVVIGGAGGAWVVVEFLLVRVVVGRAGGARVVVGRAGGARVVVEFLVRDGIYGTGVVFWWWLQVGNTFIDVEKPIVVHNYRRGWYCYTVQVPLVYNHTNNQS
jgi:hypothetical protein